MELINNELTELKGLFEIARKNMLFLEENGLLNLKLYKAGNKYVDLIENGLIEDGFYEPFNEFTQLYFDVFKEDVYQINTFLEIEPLGRTSSFYLTSKYFNKWMFDSKNWIIETLDTYVGYEQDALEYILNNINDINNCKDIEKMLVNYEYSLDSYDNIKDFMNDIKSILRDLISACKEYIEESNDIIEIIGNINSFKNNQVEIMLEFLDIDYKIVVDK